MKSIYQLTALIGNKSDGINDEKFMTAAWILYAWMRREVIDCIPLPELPATVSKSAKTGRSVAAIYQPEEHFFTLRSSVFENGIRDTVEAEIMPYRQSLLLAVRETAFLREPGAKAKPASGPLAFVGQLIDEVGLNDGRQLSTGLQRITTQQVGRAGRLFVCPRPMVASCCGLLGQKPRAWQNGYLVDGRELASDLAGSAM